MGAFIIGRRINRSVGAEHDESTLGEIDDARALVDQYDADRDQRVDAADRNASDSELQIERHGSPK
jgi:hypothetical protein